MIDISSYINPTLAVLLWAIGILVKHLKIFKKVSNNYIPLILAIVGIVLNLIMNGVNFNSALAGFVTAMVCVGVHKSGQETFGVNGLDLSSVFSGVKLEDQSDDEEL